MDESQEKPRGFKVDDRRRFSDKGELKPEHRHDPEPAPSKQAEAASAPSTGPAPGTGAAGVSGPGEGQAQPEMNFATFVIGLSTQALMNLGEIPDPATGHPVRDLDAAQQVIDILGLLQLKTRGNLDHEESGLLESILFDLRMKYVEIARQHAG